MPEFDTRIQQKTDTQVNFESNNPILLQNELVIVKMTDGSIKFKVGDGVSHFNSLQYTDIYLTNSIATKANIDSPAFTGSPTAPTQSSTDNSTRIATTAFVQTVVQSAGGGGTEIILSSSQPSGQSEGSIWFRQL